MFSPKTQRLAAENYTVSRQDVDVQLGGEAFIPLKDAFIVTCPKSAMKNSKSIHNQFEAIRTNTYRAILDPGAGLEAIAQFGDAIKELNCADAINNQYKEFVTHAISPLTTNPGIVPKAYSVSCEEVDDIKDAFIVVVGKDQFHDSSAIPDAFKLVRGQSYRAILDVNAGLFALTDFCHALKALKEGSSVISDFDQMVTVESYAPKMRLQT